MNIKNKEGLIIATYPSIQGNGSKYTATNIAHQIKTTQPELKVCLLDFDFKVPYLAGYLAGYDKEHSIDNLIEKIDGGFFSEDSMRDNTIQLKNGVDLLKGTQLKHFEFFIKQEHVRQILKQAQKMYDVVIVALSSGNDSISIPITLLAADHVLLIGRNDYSNYLSLKDQIKFVQNYAKDNKSIKLIFNMFESDSDLDFHPILVETGVPLVAWVRFMSETTNNKHIEGSKLLNKFIKQKREDTPYDSLVEQFIDELDERNHTDTINFK